MGWQRPFIPTWMGWLFVVSFVATLLAWMGRRLPWRMAAMGLGVPLIAWAQGGLVSAGWFPSTLRHQLFAMATLVLPAGWLFARGLDLLPRSGRVGPALRWGLAPLLGVVTLAAAPDGYALRIPLSQEYQFFTRTLRALPDRGSVVVLELSHQYHLTPDWLSSHRPDWRQLTPDQLPPPSRGSAGPIFLFIDRTCFLNTACFGDQGRDARPCRDPEVIANLSTRPSPYGRMLPHCRAVLDALPWQEVAHRTLRRPPDDRFYDLPSIEDAATVAVLRWPAVPVPTPR